MDVDVEHAGQHMVAGRDDDVGVGAGLQHSAERGDLLARYADVAGPDTQDLVDMARRTHQMRGREVKLVPTWSAMFDETMAGNIMLPGERVRIAPTTFEEWLAAAAVDGTPTPG